MELEYLRGRPATDADVVLGAGLWSVPEPEDGDRHRVSPAVVVPAAVEHDGVNHRYLDSMSGLRSPGEVLGAPAHDAGSLVLVRWGFGSGGTFTLDPGGRGAPMSGRTNRGGGSSSHLVQSGDTSQVTLTGVRLAGKRTRLWIALYKPIR